MFSDIYSRRLAVRQWTKRLLSWLLAGGIGIAALSAGNARAATIMGAGVVLSCGSWVEARKAPPSPNKAAAEQWVLGFLSGVAMFTASSPLDGLDPGAVFVWLDNACQQHPLERLPGALVQFVRVRAETAKPNKPAPASAKPEASPPKRR